MNHRALAVVALAVRCSCPSVSAGTAETISAQIRSEATRANHDPGGRPLPLASHWTTGSHKLSAGWVPERQLELIEQGHFLLPWFAHPPTTRELSEEARKSFLSYYEKPIQRARELKLPIVFVATQWEHLLSGDSYLSLSPEKNPNVEGRDGKIQPVVSPFGPVEPWIEVGGQWTSNPQMLKIQEWYPDPPLVIFLSNNEHAKLTWPKLGQDSRCPEDSLRDDNAKRRVAAEGWIERYRALQRGMRDGLASAAWRTGGTRVSWCPTAPANTSTRQPFRRNTRTQTAGSCWMPTSIHRSIPGDCPRRSKSSRWPWSKANRQRASGSCTPIRHWQSGNQ